MQRAAIQPRLVTIDRTGLRPARLFVGFCLIVALALACVWTRYHVNETGYALEKARQQVRQARIENRQLSLALSHLTSPENLERQAKEFELNKPASEQVRKVRTDAPAP